MKKLNYELRVLLLSSMFFNICVSNNPDEQVAPKSSAIVRSPLLRYAKMVTDSFFRKSPDASKKDQSFALVRPSSAKENRIEQPSSDTSKKDPVIESPIVRRSFEKKMMDCIVNRDPLLPWQREVADIVECNLKGFTCTVLSDNSLKIKGNFKVGEKTWHVRAMNGLSVRPPAGISFLDGENTVDWVPEILIAPVTENPGCYDITITTPRPKYFKAVTGIKEFTKNKKEKDLVAFMASQIVRSLHPCAPIYGE